MSVFPRTPVRSTLACAAAVVVLAVLAASAANASGGNGAAGSTGSPGVSGGTVGSSGTISAGTGFATAPTGIVSSTSAVAPYPWCCSPSAPGISATGSAPVHGNSSAARDEAIARAVADATDQARAAAAAAGVGLGPVISLQVSSPPTIYPLMMGASSGTSGPSTSMPSTIGTFASVTITFAIA
jgi:hypothetical protein